MTTKTHRTGCAVRIGFALFVLTASALSLGAARRVDAQTTRPTFSVRTLTIHYTAHNGRTRSAVVLLPSWYGPRNHPAIPLVIAPHGRGGNGRANATFWDDLPARGGFAVINPDGMGLRRDNPSYGYPGQIDDLARMPEIAEHALSWLRIDHSRIYALGSSMGGQETLLLVARHPHLLAGAAAMDSVTDLGSRYDELPAVACNAGCLQRYGRSFGYVLRDVMRQEVGGAPSDVPAAYAARSPMSLARQIAFSDVPLQIWWSEDDRIVTDQEGQSGRLVERLRRLNPEAPLVEYVGTWPHSHEMRAAALLPVACARFGLVSWTYARAVAADQPPLMRLPAAVTTESR